ncbi:ABC transporter permease [Stenotrophomonas sp. SORGH_AS_0321]|uniref:ABC transporter permease n=1 Tax=Stenotrophomonas sp. SORGH_AS_0321 TaxID=3041787 RepID=UPI0028646CD0|nr:ABC transporter permease [Stenotrophomonas sp. SORGH_AS_0321]MDR6095867.1 lipopolysaccharide transport system permease protein [Stenotrophomonas sp. SORGH_AS_0321]
MKSRRLELMLSLTGRDIQKKYKDSVLGALWGVLVPLIMLAIYTVIFSAIFNAKWKGIEVHSKADYAVLLFIGLIVYNIFAESLARAPSAVLGSPNLVKKVVFPLEVLPAVVVMSSLYNAGVACVALVVFLVFSSFGLHWQIVLLPILIVPMIALTLGVTYLFASLGVFFRDIDQLAGLLARILQYLTPVLYPSIIFPDTVGQWMRLSPLAIYVEQIRALIVAGTLPDWGSYLWAVCWSGAILWLGYWWFQRTRRAFADVV